MSASWMRLRGLLRKEALQVIRDPSSVALSLVMPVVLLIIFGYGITFDAEDVQVALVVDRESKSARQVRAALSASPSFSLREASSLAQAHRLLDGREVAAVVHVPSDFAESLLTSGRGRIGVRVDGVDANRARLVANYLSGVAAQAARDAELPRPSLVRVADRVCFNAELDSQRSLIPGLLALILTLTGVLLTALVYVRERERGTLEALLVTPIRPGELMLAKLVPYFALGMIGLAVTASLGKLLFGVPLRGSILALSLVASLFMLASLGFGLLLSVAAPNQLMACQVSLVAGFLPALFLSGMLFDLAIQPAWVRVLSRAIPTTYFVDASRTLFLHGDVWPVLGPDLLSLGALATLCLGAARLKIKKTL